MRQTLYLALLVFLFSCGDANETTTVDTAVKTDSTSEVVSDKSVKTEEATSSEESVASSGNSDCMEFANEYGKFVDEYIRIYKKYLSNPSDMAILGEYQELLKTMEKMNEQKESNSDCMSNDSEYRAAIMKHTTRMTKELTTR